MRNKTYRSLGLDVVFSVFDSVDEYNAAAKRTSENACLEDANDNIVYRGALADFRSDFCAKVEEITSVARKCEPITTKDGKPRVDSETGEPMVRYTESERDYIERALAESKRTIESFQDVANEIATKLIADPTQKERAVAGPKTPPKSVKELAEKLVASGKAAHVAQLLTHSLGRHVDHDAVALAQAIHEDQLAEARKAKSKFETV